MKKLLLLIAFAMYALCMDYTITCKGDLQANSIFNLSSLPNSSLLSLGMEQDGIYVYGDIDPANSPIVFYDDTSPVCGGNGKDNILISKYCPYDVDSCWDVTIGTGTTQLLIKNKDGLYTNNTHIVNGYPCMNRDTTNFSVGAYDVYTNEDIGFINANLMIIENENISTPTVKELTTQKNACTQVDLIQYIDEWEDLKTTQNEELFFINDNTHINTFDFLLSNFESNNDDALNDLATTYNDYLNIDDELMGFQSDYESIVYSSFDSYSNIFGFGGYGNAPTPYNLSFLGQEYKLFDLTTMDDSIPFIRYSLLSFSYVWGLVIFTKVTI